MAEELECIPDLFTPDLNRYVFTFSPAGDEATGGQRKTEGAGGDEGLLEGNGGETSQPGGQEDCTATQDKTQQNSAEDDGSNHTHRYTNPIAELTLEKLPPDIRTGKNLGLILEMSERVVRLHSTGTNEERADGEKPEPQGTDSVVGAGLIYTILRTRGGPEVVVVTPPDVLSSSQAVQRSAAEVAVERRGSKTACSAPGRARPSWSGPDPQEGFTMAAYAFDPTAEVQRLSIAQKPGEYPVLKSLFRTEDRCGNTVCVLSWTPAGDKCVSFGRVLEETQGQLIHDAPVPPGCSGCPVVVLSPSGNSFLLTTRAGEVQAGGAAVEVDWDRVKAAALLMEGFVPVPDLALELLPEEMRSEENLQLILETAKLVVRVNNNKVSDTRPEDDQFRARGVKSMTGTGRVVGYSDKAQVSGLEVVTNKHVLFCQEEVRNATVDINFSVSFSADVKERRTRTARGRGALCGASTQRDVTLVNFFLKEAELSRFQRPALPAHTIPLGKSKGPKSSVAVAVVSHPLGEAKQVSFGHLYLKKSGRVLLHDAATKPGSSGAPLIVFTGEDRPGIDLPKFLYHVGKVEKIGLNECKGITFPQHLEPSDRTFKHVEPSQAVGSLQLLQFAPVFAAFLLHPERYRSSLQKQAPGVCGELSRMDVHSAVGKSGTAGEMLLEIVQDAPSLFPPDIPRGDVTKALDVLMTSGTPCYCRCLVHALTRSGSSDKIPDGEVFTSTAAAPREFDAKKPWPWSRDFSRDTLCGERECLLQACLAAVEMMNNVKPFLTLLVLILNANRIANRIRNLIEEPDTAARPTTHDASEEIIYRRCRQSTRGGEVRVQQPVDDRGRMTSAEKGKPETDGANRRATADDVIGDFDASSVLVLVLRCCEHLRFHHSFLDALIGLEEGKHPDFCHDAYGKWLHLVLHYRLGESNHPFRKSRAFDIRRICQCGAPSFDDVDRAAKAMWQNLEMIKDLRLARLLHPSGNVSTPQSRPHPASNYSLDSGTLGDARCIVPRRNTPPSQLDTMENFSRGSDVLTRVVLAVEVFLFNCCSLLRQLRADIYPWYESTPVSVYGRPGNWPGHVTPARVKAAAWRLIQDAFSDSGFGTAVLQALEEDADRREKFTDLYVDMKQLKFQGKLDGSMFTLQVVNVLRDRVASAKADPCADIHSRNATISVMYRLMRLLFC